MAIRYIKIDDADAVNSRGQYAPLRVFESREISYLVSGFATTDHGYTVVGFLPAGDRFIAHLGKSFRSKLLRYLFDLLQDQHIGAGTGKPFKDMRQPNIEGIYIPGCYFHAAFPMPLCKSNASSVGLRPRKAT